MKLFEVERKFTWSPAIIKTLLANGGTPAFPSRPIIRSKSFSDTYYDMNDRLSSNGLWLRKRLFQSALNEGNSARNGVWEAKQALPGSSFTKSTYDETKDLSRILQVVRKHMPNCPGPDKSYGLEEICHFETLRRSFRADGKFTVVLDETNFGHSVGEVELLAQDSVRAHAEIDAFLVKYAWLFDCSEPKGKLTAYFEKFPPPIRAGA